MRILHVTPYYEHAWAYGGIPRVATLLSQAQADCGHEIAVWTTDAASAGERAKSGRTSPRSNLAVHTWRNLSNRLAYHQQAFLPLVDPGSLAYLLSRWDIVHIHGHRHLLGAMAAVACRLATIPYIVQPNGTALRVERRLVRKGIVDRLGGSAILAGASCVVAVSQWEKRGLVDMGAEPHRIEVVPNPVWLEGTDAIKPLGRRVVFLGQETPRKHTSCIVAAVARLPSDVALVLAGPTGESAARLRRLAEHHGIGERVHLPGVVQGEARSSLLRNADVVCYPTEHEAFGLVPFEALFCGTPVVVGNDAGTGEWLEQTGGGRAVQPDDVGALHRALEGLLEDLPSWRRRAQRAADVVAELFAPAAIAEQLERVVRCCL